MVATMNDLRVKGILDYNDAEVPYRQVQDWSNVPNEVPRWATSGHDPESPVPIKGFPRRRQIGEVNPSLGPQGGGELEMDHKRPQGELCIPRCHGFEIEMQLDNPTTATTSPASADLCATHHGQAAPPPLAMGAALPAVDPGARYRQVDLRRMLNVEF